MCKKWKSVHVAAYCMFITSWLCRLFLRKLKDTLKIPVLALVDSDPYGLKILSVYMKGNSHSWCLCQLCDTALSMLSAAVSQYN